MTTVENQYLAGNFAPVKDELTVSDLPVEGAIPKELNGRLLRNGPNPIAPDPGTYHWFLGDGMLHAIELRGGKAVSYRNRWVRTDSACEQLGERPPQGQTDDIFDAVPNPANTHVVAHAGKIFALVEAFLPTQVRPDLSTVGRYDFDGKLRSAMTAHPKVDPVTGEMLFFGYDPFGPPWLRYHVANADGELVRSEDIDIKGPSMVHDFAITENNVVFLDLPVVFDFDLLGKRPFPAEWKPDYGARVGVMPRDGGNADVRWFEVELCYVFHPMNAYDDGARVVLDVVRHERMFATDIHGPFEGPPTLDRWTIDLGAGKVLEERLDDHPQELPRVDERVVGRRHRYGYAGFEALYKHDLVGGTTETHDFGRGHQASEGVFVPASEAAGEDEGWVLTVVYDPGRDGSDLAVLDATDFSGSPVAMIRLPQRVPNGFHGWWLPEGAA
jgi:carotenoid cleavage dioxygenase